LRRSPTTPGQSSHPTLFQDPLPTRFVRVLKSLREGTLTSCAACRLYPSSTSAKPPHHTRQLSVTFDLSCMPVSQVFPSSISRISFTRHCAYHRGEPVVNYCHSFCRADTLKEWSNEVAGKVLGSCVRHVAIAVVLTRGKD